MIRLFDLLEIVFSDFVENGHNIIRILKRHKQNQDKLEDNK